MTSQLVVDTGSPTPPYEQIRSQLAGLIGRGVLPPGQRLPPVRQLAADLGLAPGTVARAYRELELAGQVVSRRGGGTRVAAHPPGGDLGAAAEALAAHAVAYVTAARRLGVSDDELVAAVRREASARAAQV
jgi:DNA-binding transcriptional regulator YhcF (GntR family)